MEQVKIQLKLVKSPLPGIKEDYTAIVVTNGTATADDLVADAHAAEPQISEIAAKQVHDTEWLYIGRMLAEGKYVNIGGIGLAPCVDGSLLHADEEVGSDRIGIQVTVHDNALVKALQTMEIATAADPDALPFVFAKVEDVSTNTFGVITPGGAFKTLGDRQSCGLEGERIEIMDAAGVTHVIADATGDREGMWLLATAPATLATGKATVTVFSRGKNTPEAEPTPSPARQVTILAAVGPEPVVPDFNLTAGYSQHSGSEEGFTFNAYDPYMLFEGTGLEKITGATFEYTSVQDDTPKTAEFLPKDLSFSEDRLMVQIDAVRPGPKPGEMTLTFKSASGATQRVVVTVVS